VPDEKQTLHQL